jgi:hypothetical protein
VKGWQKTTDENLLTASGNIAHEKSSQQQAPTTIYKKTERIRRTDYQQDTISFVEKA